MKSSDSRKCVWLMLILSLCFVQQPQQAYSDVQAIPPHPTYDNATVNGTIEEWDLENDFFADMHRAGHTNKPVEAKVYLRYDCYTEIMYALVLTVNYPIIVQNGAEVWFKVNGVKLVSADDENELNPPPDFDWYNKSGGYASGWEASFSIAPGSYTIEVHCNVYDGGSQTAGTNKNGTALEMDCSWIPVELTSFMAESMADRVTLKWTTASETENLGYHVYRSRTEAGEYERITRELIQGAGSSNSAHQYSYVDMDVTSGNTYFYKLADVSYHGKVNMHGPISLTVNEVPAGYSLEQNYPNPFNPTTAINFSLREAGAVTLKIYNIQGQTVRTLIQEEKPMGSYSVMWNGSDDLGIVVPSGSYLYMLQINGFSETKKLIYMK